MKKKTVITAIMTILLVVTGCEARDTASQIQNDSMGMVQIQDEELVSAIVLKEEVVRTMDETRTNLEECLELPGKADTESAALLGGGKENIAADGVTQIGRTYSVNMFDEEAEVGTLYDENGCVDVVTIELENPNAGVYGEKLRELYGEPTEINDMPSEGGATWETWNMGEVQLRLYQQYELSNIEITKIPDLSETDAFDTDVLFTGWLPDSVTQIKAETEPNELLKQTIIDYYEIPEDSWEQTKYYYNYVDLNGDGSNEIFAVIIGSYTSGSGGNSALWCYEYEGEMRINQAFTLVNTPIIVTKDATNGQEYGARSLILQRTGGGAETEIVQLTCSDGVYTNVADVPAIDSVEGIEGTAIICNNLIEDMENGNYLTLAD